MVPALQPDSLLIGRAQAIADAGLGQHELWPLGIDLDLLAQLTDIDAQILRIRQLVPQLLEQEAMGQHLAGVLHQHPQQLIFLGRQLDLAVDLVRRIVKVGDREVKLSPKEYELLRVLVQHAGKVLTHRFLLKELWDELTDAQYLRVYVRQLRQKIEVDPERPQFVLTETGIGYRLRAPD